MFFDELIYCILLFTTVGVIDDIVHLKPAPKLALQCLAGVISMMINAPGTVIEGLIIVGWLVLLVNAFNLIDGIDGLAISYACVVFGWSLLVHGPNLITFTLLGASIGFMPFNIYKATSYLGDSGSHALGSAIGYLTLPFADSVNGNFQIADLALVTLPLADITFVTITRRLRRSAITTGGTDHLAHRLARVVGASLVVVIFVGGSLLLAAISVFARQASILVQSVFLGIGWFDAVFVVTLLERRTRSFFT